MVSHPSTPVLDLLTSGRSFAKETATPIPIKKKFFDTNDLVFSTIVGDALSPPPPLIPTISLMLLLVRCNPSLVQCRRWWDDARWAVECTNLVGSLFILNETSEPFDGAAAVRKAFVDDKRRNRRYSAAAFIVYLHVTTVAGVRREVMCESEVSGGVKENRIKIPKPFRGFRNVSLGSSCRLLCWLIPYHCQPVSSFSNQVFCCQYVHILY